MRALLTPEIAPRMGIVLFRPGSELMPLFMQGRVLLEPEPERYSSFASGAVPAVSQPLADDPAVRAVFRNEAVIRRAGGVECLESWLLREKGCQWPHSDWHSENMTFGNAFLEKRYSTTGKIIRLETSPAKYTRRGVEEDVYWWVPSFNEPTAFAPGSVFHLLEPDINQELYGLPEYLSALNSAWLNESATLFRRKYYENGAHAGYIMYVTDAVQDRNDIEMLRENMVKSKGRNNFKNLFLYAPQGKADGIKIIPLSEVATKDDFFNIKKASAADLLDAHRIPFQLMGGKPENVGSLGDIEKVAKVFVRNELIPLQDRIREINGWLGQEVIRFKNYSLDTDNG